jgi:hypothetical protein
VRVLPAESGIHDLTHCKVLLLLLLLLLLLPQTYQGALDMLENVYIKTGSSSLT